MLREYKAPQGTDAWREARRGVVTASNFKVALDTTAKGLPSSKAQLYAMNVAREQLGGKAPDIYQNAAMREGHEQEPLARAAYEDRYGVIVEERGLITTDDRLFGVSVDGLVGDDGGIEIKTMVSSERVFECVGKRDISEYRDQVLGAMWLLNRQWWDVCLWAPDMKEIDRELTVIRVTRDQNEIDALEAGLMKFMRLVNETKRLLVPDAPAFHNGYQCNAEWVAYEPELIAA